MTTWNPFTILPGFARPSGGHGDAGSPSAAFDPSRTGDPLGPSTGRPSIGFGDTRTGAGGASFESRRNPIGFGPPAGETRTERQFRTELSFKRHRSDAAATGPRPRHVPAASPSAGWTTPGLLPDRSIVRAQAGDPQGEPDKVPFYKREISFRRKRGETAPAEPVAETPVHEEPVHEEPVHEEPEHEEPEHEEPQVDEAPHEVVAEEQIADVAPAEEPVAASVPEEPVSLEETSPVEEAPSAEGDPAEEPAVVEQPLAEQSHPDETIAETPTTEEAPTQDEPAVAGNRGKPRFGRANGTPAPAASTRKPDRGSRGRKVVGLKIGASQIAAAVVADGGAGPELVQLARRPIESGIVVDGEIRDAEALTAALKALFDENKLPRKDVRIGLASNRIGVRTLDIVGIDDEARFDNAVRFKAHEVLPVAVNESVLDYRVLQERPSETGEAARRVLLVVAPRDQVEPYTEVARHAGLKLTCIDLEALGLLRAFVEPRPFAVRAVDDTATVVVAIGHESSTLLVAGGGSCEFTRVFDWGGDALQDAIAHELDVRPAEAATILRHLSLSGPGRQLDALDEVARAKALDAVRLRLTPFARELVSSLQFYQTQPESLGIGEILVTGGTSHLEGLGDALHQMIGVQVRVGDPLARVKVAGTFDPAIEATIGSMAVPIGLAMDDGPSRGVNLLPKDQQRARKRPSLVAVGAPVAVALPIAALALLYVGAHGKVSDRQSQLDAVQSQIASLPEPTGAEIDASIVGEQAQRAIAVANVLGGRMAFDGVFRDLARVLPGNVWLKQLTAKMPDPSAVGTTTPVAAGTPAPAPTGVTIDGYTYSHPDVARLLARLATLPSLARVTLQKSEEATVGTKDVVHFVILADLNQTGGAR